VVESFVLREGTDYGERDVPHEAKVAQVIRQLERGEARILFDPVTQRVDVVVADPAALIWQPAYLALGVGSDVAGGPLPTLPDSGQPDFIRVPGGRGCTARDVCVRGGAIPRVNVGIFLHRFRPTHPLLPVCLPSLQRSTD
jgi:uncharacterized protein YheU (UPF0270 family)